jgi:hypothetical protein
MFNKRVLIVLILAAVFTLATRWPHEAHYGEVSADNCIGFVTLDVGWPLPVYHQESYLCQAPSFEADLEFLLPVDYLFYVIVVLGLNSLFGYFFRKRPKPLNSQST